MKSKIIAAAVALLCATPAAHAQVFNAGYTFTYYFPALPSYQTPSPPIDTGLFVTQSYQSVTATIKWEIFDSLPAGAPVHAGIWNPGDVGWASFNDTWLDGEGSFRISILSGSQFIQNYFVSVHSFDTPGSGHTVYSAVIPAAPVPEPVTIALFAGGFAALCVFRRRARSI